MTEEKIGKIQSVSFGHGGYNEAQFGLSLTLHSEPGSWGVSTFEGFWSMEPGSNYKWNRSDQDKAFSDLCRKVSGYLTDAKVDHVDQLKGKPVVVTFEGNVLKSWRILTEAI